MFDLQRVVQFVQLLQIVLQLAGARAGDVTITSFCRDPLRNAQVGGNPNSFHLVCLAMDLVGERAILSRAAAIWRAVGLDVVDEGDHWHFEFDGPLLR